MCVVCEISVQTVLQLGLSYAPHPIDQEQLLMINQRVERIVQNPVALDYLDRRVDEWIGSIDAKDPRNLYTPTVLKNIVDYNKVIYGKE
jgi:hypothetical protein